MNCHGSTTPKARQLSIEELEVEIKKLTFRDRTMLATWVVWSLDELSESGSEFMRTEEAEHCLDELEQGLVTESQAEDVLRRA